MLKHPFMKLHWSTCHSSIAMDSNGQCASVRRHVSQPFPTIPVVQLLKRSTSPLTLTCGERDKGNQGWANSMDAQSLPERRTDPGPRHFPRVMADMDWTVLASGATKLWLFMVGQKVLILENLWSSKESMVRIVDNGWVEDGLHIKQAATWEYLNGVILRIYGHQIMGWESTNSGGLSIKTSGSHHGKSVDSKGWHADHCL